jgi:BirA family transcriptional regulator, biotin operon repressor / biotin---[acetyl-CoA-carboxylase] ligase
VGVGGLARSNRLYIGDIVSLEETSSTNQVLVDRARAGATDGLVVVADRQSAGRGRYQRSWVSPPVGSLLCSILLRPELPVDQLYNLTSVVALAARRACVGFGGEDVSLKWPNDLVTPAGKLAGVLAELVISTPPPAVVVGIGCNLYFPPGWPPADDSSGFAELIKDATTLEESCGRQISRDEFLDSFLDEVDSLYSTLVGPDGPGTIRREYASSCSTIGQRVQVDTPTGRLVGFASGVNDDGSLQVEVDGQTQRISVADVVHLRPAESE